MHVLALYGVMRMLLSKYPKAATILTFNLRKRDRRSNTAPGLLTSRSSGTGRYESILPPTQKGVPESFRG
jgi:hypothetical protein